MTAPRPSRSRASASGTAVVPVVNHERFALLTRGDADLQEQLRGSFVRQSAQVREQLAAACAQGTAQFAEVLHMLEGSCAFVAGERLSAVLGGVKAAGVPQQLQKRRALLAGILEELRVLEAALVAASASAARR